MTEKSANRLLELTRTLGTYCCICIGTIPTVIGNERTARCRSCREAGKIVPIPYHELGLEPWQVLDRKMGR